MAALARLGAGVALALVLAGCGSHSSSSPTTTGTTSTGKVVKSPITVTKPLQDARVSSPVTVAGTANVFEANVTVEILGADGKVVGKTFTTASCGTGCRGKYSVAVPFKVSKAQLGAVLVHDDDAAGTGTPPHSVQILVTLLP